MCTVLERDRVPPLPLHALCRDRDRRAARHCTQRHYGHAAIALMLTLWATPESRS